MLPSALMTAALTASMAQAKPEAVVLTTSPVITRPALTSSRTLAIYEASLAVRQHLEARIQETWGVEVESTPPIEPSDQTFYVHLDWPTVDELVVGIADPDHTLAERSIEANDPETAKVMTWLLVRSTIERSLIRPTHEVPVADETPPITEETPIEEIASAPSEPEPVPITVERVEPTRVEKPEVYSLGIVALGHLDSGSGISAVPAIQFRYRLHQWVVIGGEITFRHEERADGLVDVYHVPLTGFVGMRPWEGSLPLELGLSTTFDPKFVKLPNDGGASASFWIGPYARARFPFLSFGRSQFAVVGDAALQFNTARNRYMVNGTEHTDGLVDFRLSGGVEWAWR